MTMPLFGKSAGGFLSEQETVFDLNFTFQSIARITGKRAEQWRVLVSAYEVCCCRIMAIVIELNATVSLNQAVINHSLIDL